MFKLDHLIIAVNNLEQSSRDYEQLGFTVLPGGRHANGASHNALIVFRDGSYIELLAPTGEPAQSGYADFSFLTQHGEGLVGFALRSDDLIADAAAIQQRGLAMNSVTTGGRKRPDGLELQWRSAGLAQGGLSPFLIQDVTPRAWRVSHDAKAITHANTATGIGIVVNLTTSTPTMIERYTALFGASPEPASLSKHHSEVRFKLTDGWFHISDDFPPSVKPGAHPAVFGDVPYKAYIRVSGSSYFHQATHIEKHEANLYPFQENA